MCVGVESERLMVRLDPARYNEALQKKGCRPMDFTGRVMKGYVFVDIDALITDEQLEYWIVLALEFNKLAKPSRKRNGELSGRTTQSRKKRVPPLLRKERSL
jgi:hypothetical protein